MPLDLTDDERTALVGLLAGLIESDHFPQSERVQLLRGILAKLRSGLAWSSPSDDDPDPSTAEVGDVEAAEAIRFSEGFQSAQPGLSAAPKARKKPLSGTKSPVQRSSLIVVERKQR
jgi:hypothetical protein